MPASVCPSIYAAAGSPFADTLTGICRTCGGKATGVSFSDWVRPTFMDWDKLAAGEIICSACRFCFDDINPTLDARLGKPKQRMRNYSHFVLDGQWTPLSKGQKPNMLALLSQSPDVAVIADSGQKHIIFRARRGWWQFEEQAISPDLPTLHIVHGLTEELYMGGISKAEIESGSYSHWQVKEFGLDEWHAIEQRLRAYRGSLLFALALFLTTKPDEKKESDDESANC